MACQCIIKLNEELAKTNTVAVTVLVGLKGTTERAALWTERLRSLRDGKKATPVFAAYCPMCGVKY